MVAVADPAVGPERVPGSAADRAGPRAGPYALEERIGRGSAGSVYRASDPVSGRTVALKLFEDPDPEELYRLKREFRHLARLAHPNLVRLHELSVEPGRSYIAMELVDGRPLDGTLLRSKAGVDWTRLRRIFGQLATAVLELHESGIVHRDLKPGNVLVARDDRVVVLDFGLATHLDPQGGSLGTTLAGTLSYMAPELIQGRRVGPAIDWYSVGVMLYQAIAGCLPFEGRALMASPREPAAPLAEALPASLERVVHGLLSEDPAAREPAARQLARLAADGREGAAAAAEAARGAGYAAVRAGARGSAPIGLIGRERELRRLREAVRRVERGGTAVAVLEGESGIGKTALLEHFAASVEAPDGSASGALVLRSACHPNETLAFRAFDGIVDELARWLVQHGERSAAASALRHAAELCVLFPVLGRVPAIHARRGPVSADPQETRHRGLLALRELLVRLGEERPLVLAIDDAQWADRDDAHLLEVALAGPDPPSLLLLLARREVEPEGQGELAARAAGVAPAETLGLAPLDRDELDRLARAECGAPLAPGVLDRLASESAGNPFIARSLARLAAGGEALPDVGALVEAQVAGLPEGARELLELLSTPGQPLDQALVLRLARDPALLELLLGRGLVKVIGAGAVRSYAPFHDRIREALLAHLAAGERVARYRTLARALEDVPSRDPSQLLRFTIEAGDGPSATRLALRLADDADGLAFDRAVSLYRRTLELGPEGAAAWQIQERLAGALVRAGRAAASADAYEAAADGLEAAGGSATEVLRLRRRAVEELLRGGQRARGIPALRELLRRAGLGWWRVEAGALAALLVGRPYVGALRRLHPPQSRPARGLELERLEVCWAAGVGLSNFETIRAAEFQVRHAVRAVRAGDPAHLARSLSTEGLLSSWEGRTRGRRRAAGLLVEGRRLAIESGDSRAVAHSLMAGAVAAFYERRFADAVATAEEAETTCRDECAGAFWEIANVLSIRANVLSYRGEFATLQRELPARIDESRRRGDLYAPLMLPLGMPNLTWLAAGDAATARSWVEQAGDGVFAGSAWTLYQGGYAAIQELLHRGEAEAAWAALRDTWRRLRRNGLFRFQPVRVELLELRARCALALAPAPASASAREGTSRLHARVRRDLRRLRREDAHWTAPLAEALAGALHARRGERDAARAALRRAVIGFERFGQGLHRAAARHRLAVLEDDPGARDAELQWLAGRGTRDPARLLAVVLP